MMTATTLLEATLIRPLISETDAMERLEVIRFTSRLHGAPEEVDHSVPSFKLGARHAARKAAVRK